MAAGTFCADTDAQVLYVWLPDGGNPNEQLVEASVPPVCFGPGWGKEPRHHVVLDHNNLKGFEQDWEAGGAAGESQLPKATTALSKTILAF